MALKKITDTDIKLFVGHNPIPMKKVVNGFVKSVEGKGNGEIIRMYDNC